MKFLWKNADNCIDDVVQSKCAANRIRLAAEMALKKAVAENGDPRARRVVGGNSEIRPEPRTDS
jgi:hypothetical protein